MVTVLATPVQPRVDWTLIPLGPDDIRPINGTQATIGPLPGQVRTSVQTTTTGFERGLQTSDRRHNPEHIRALRDQVCLLTGLTKQEVASALGVDRRSLSGWVSGEIRASAEHVRRLELLVNIAADMERSHPTQSGAILRTLRVDGRTLLDLLAQGRYLDLRSWRLLAAAVPGRPTGRVALRESGRPPRRLLPAVSAEGGDTVTRSLEHTPPPPRSAGKPFPLPLRGEDPRPARPRRS